MQLRLNMKMEVEVISRETIKPSSPTPNHLKTFNLSFFDQISSPTYVPVILFYEINHNNNNNSNIFQESSFGHHRRLLDLIKKSLAETLTRFYPFAGSIEDNMFVDCNDDGVEYVEARVSNCRLSQILQHPNLNELANQLLPWDPYSSYDEVPAVVGSSRSIGPISTKMLLIIQVTIFDECGGIVISGYFSHKIADASSIFNFINDWAATARTQASSTDDDNLLIKQEQQQQVQAPDFKLLQSLFPRTDELRKRFISKVSGGHNIVKIKGQESIVVKKFVFGESKIAELKKKSITSTTRTTNITVNDATNNINDDVVPHTTRYQALTAFLWKCFIDVDVTEKKKEQEKAFADDNIVSSRVYALTHALNLRAKMVPPLPTNSMGNLIGTSMATVTLRTTSSTKNDLDEDNEMKYPNLVSKVKESINNFNGCEYVRKLQTGDLPSDEYLIKEVIDSRRTGGTDQMVFLHIISWCGFKIYERADFGWGKPTWVSSAPLPFKNTVRLMDTSSGDSGIEAWLSLSEQDMAEFERHPELIAFTT